MGYARTGSVPSIAAGWTVGLLCTRFPLITFIRPERMGTDFAPPVSDGLGGYRISNREPYGVELALLASVVLGGSSIPRALRSFKPVPSVLSLISLFGLFMFGDAWRKTL